VIANAMALDQRDKILLSGKRLSADLQKCGLAERKRSGAISRLGEIAAATARNENLGARLNRYAPAAARRRPR